MKKRNVPYIAVSWILVALCMAVIFYLSARSGDESAAQSGSVLRLFDLMPQLENLVRKCAHALEYMGLAMLMFNALYATFGAVKPILSFGLTVAYAVTDEFHQLFVEGRAGRFSDILIDGIGAAAGVIAALLILTVILKIKGRKDSDKRN